MNATLPEPRYFELEPTATYARRRCGWFPAGAGADRCGTLRTILYPSRGSGDGVEVDVYAVQEQTDYPLPGVRRFLLMNETDADQEQPYEVVCIWGVVVKCSCRAGKCKSGECKHESSINRLIAEGVL